MYLSAIGGKAATDRIKNCVVKGTTTISSGHVVAYESEQSGPDKGHESFAIQNDTGSNCPGDSRCEHEQIPQLWHGELNGGQVAREFGGHQRAYLKLSCRPLW